MPPIPTPASTFSAYGRRRHILQNTPSGTIAPTKRAAPPQRPPQRTLWRAPRPPTLPPALLDRLSPVLTFTETALLQSLLLTLLTLLLIALLTPVVTYPARFLVTCDTVPPRPAHPFPAFLARVLALPVIALALATRQLLLKTSHTTLLVGLPLTALLQASLTNFLSYGSLPPHAYLIAACTPLKTSVLPAWQDILPQFFHAALAASLHHLLSRHSPPQSLISHRGISLAVVPAALAVLPLLPIPVVALWAGYHASLRALGSVIAAFVTTLSVLISWTIQSGWHETRVTVLTPDMESQKLGDYLRDESPPSVVLPSLRAVTTSSEALHCFIGYTDASGNSWRVLLAHCLHPVNNVRASLQTRGTPTLFASTAPLWRVVLPPEEVSLAVTSTIALARVYEECAKADTYGVVHRTLPYVLAELLRCKLETGGFLTTPEVEVGEGVRRFIGIRSTREMVVAVDDAVTLCLYRIVGAFKGHLMTYLRGGEAEWDRGLNSVLQAFLEYQIP